MCHCTEYKLSGLQVRISEENKLNATIQQFITAKIPGCALKQGSKTQVVSLFSRWFLDAHDQTDSHQNLVGPITFWPIYNIP